MKEKPFFVQQSGLLIIIVVVSISPSSPYGEVVCNINAPNGLSGSESTQVATKVKMINPLHHIPIVSSIYRAATGDEIGIAPRLIGAALFGGPIGIVIAGVTALFEEMSGGSFSITNGGVFGSLLSTPILNPPQSGILGMHKIEQRPVVENGEIVIRPMMYLALSYDHRLIDGREAVRFLVSIKELLEDPARILLKI